MAFLYMLAGVIVIIVMMHYLLRYLMRPMIKVTAAIKDIAQGEGDLRQRLEVESNDEFGELSEYFNLFIEKIHNSIAQVHNTTHSLEDSMKRLVDKTDSSQSLYSEQSHLTDAVVTGVNQLASNAQEVSNNASEASKLATDANGQVLASHSSLQSNITSINSLSEKMRGVEEEVLHLEQHTANIGQVLEVIKGVSEQTNLLALNAAIEAARAGEAGRGFAVVADEVRQLAQRTQESTAEIEQTIARLQNGASSAVSIMTESLSETEASVKQAIQAGEQMEAITKFIASIDETNHMVANATNEQTSVTSSIDRDIHEMSSITQQGQKNLSEVASECAALKEQFFELEQMVDKFKL
jgi:methyl-accepting chemotaxis protein